MAIVNLVNQDLTDDSLEFRLKGEHQPVGTLCLDKNLLTVTPLLSVKDQFKTLAVLKLADNNIRKVNSSYIPETVKILVLRNNQIEEMEDYSHLSVMHHLDLSENNISGAIDGCFLPGQIKHFQLDENKVSSLTNMAKLKKLRDLYLPDNLLTDISVKELPPNVVELYLHGNHIEKVDNLEQLKFLNELTLHDNNISVINNLPSSIDLGSISLSGNPLREFGMGCFKTDNMYQVLHTPPWTYEDNVLSQHQISYLQSPPVHIFNGGYDKIQEYFDQMCEGTEKPNLTDQDDSRKIWDEIEKQRLVDTCLMRILVAGKYMYGKSSLTESLVNNRLCTRNIEDRTKILSYHSWMISEEETVPIYDLGGHDCYKHLSHLFHANAKNNLSIILHDITSYDYKNTYQWIADIVVRSPESHVLMALTKSDLVPKEEHQSRKLRFRDNILQFVTREMDALDLQSEHIELQNQTNQWNISVMEKYESIKTQLLNDEMIHTVSCKSEQELEKFRQVIIDKVKSKVFHAKIPDYVGELYAKIGELGVENKAMRLDEMDDDSMLVVAAGNTGKFDEPSPAKRPRLISENNTTVTPIVKTSVPEKDMQLNYVNINDAKTVFKDIRKPSQDISDEEIMKELKCCLSFLHNHGLLLWYNSSTMLEDIIFTDLSSFVDMLKVFFQHDPTYAFSYSSLGADVKKLLLREDILETDYELYIHKLKDEGLLSIRLLNVIAKKFGFNMKLNMLVEILYQLNIAFLIPSTEKNEENIMESWMFFPWYIQTTIVPRDIKDFVCQVKVPSVKFHTLHVVLSGFLPSAFFHSFCVAIFKFIQEQSDENATKQLWEKCIFAFIKKSQIYIEQKKQPQGTDTIDIYVKSPIDVKSINRSWYFIKYCVAEADTLASKWWPGMVTNKYLRCPHCEWANKDVETVYEGDYCHWPVVKHIRKVCEVDEPKQCRLQKSHSFPGAMIYPLPKDHEEAKDCVKELKEYKESLA